MYNNDNIFSMMINYNIDCININIPIHDSYKIMVLKCYCNSY